MRNHIERSFVRLQLAKPMSTTHRPTLCVVRVREPQQTKNTKKTKPCLFITKHAH